MGSYLVSRVDENGFGSALSRRSTCLIHSLRLWSGGLCDADLARRVQHQAGFSPYRPRSPRSFSL
jgi:hypothetical protein